MLRPFVLISIQQITPFVRNGQTIERKQVFDIDFTEEYDTSAGLDKHTNTCTITLPKNIKLRTDKYLFQQSGTYDVILGGVETNKNYDGTDNQFSPLIMRGDIVTLSHGYFFFNENWEQQIEGKTIFNGFVSSVHADIPIKIECENAFHLLKRVPVGIGHWGKELISLCRFIVDRVNENFYNKDDRYPQITLYDKVEEYIANFSTGQLLISDVSCAQLLSQLEQKYHFKSFFVGNELHFGFGRVYDYNHQLKNVFEFENNILPDHDLKYKNKQDTVISGVVKALVYEKTGKKTHDGMDATKKVKKSVLVYWDIISETWKYIEKSKTEDYPKNDGGERHDITYLIEPGKGVTADELYKFGVKCLEDYFYTGFTGSFTTIGFPFVDAGDNIILLSRTVADKNGVYKVRSVKIKGGDGLTQEIELDYKLDLESLGLEFPTKFKTLKMI